MAQNTIQFTNIYGRIVGTVTLGDQGVDSASPANMEDFIQQYLDEGLSLDDVVNKFDNWSNGYLSSTVNKS